MKYLTLIRVLKKKQKRGKCYKIKFTPNFIGVISGTVKLHTDDIFNKSVIFRITEKVGHIIHVQEKLKQRFLIKKKSQRSCWIEKIKQIHKGKTSTVAKFQTLNEKLIFVSPGKTVSNYVPNCTHICRIKQNFVRSPMQVKVELFSYHISGEEPQSISSGTLVSVMIKRDSYAMTTVLEPKFGNKLWGTREFPQFIGTIDDTHVKIA